MIQGLIVAIKPVSSTILLLIGFLYIFAIFFRFRLGGPTRGLEQLTSNVAETEAEFHERAAPFDEDTGRKSVYLFRSVKESASTSAVLMVQ